MALAPDLFHRFSFFWRQAEYMAQSKIGMIWSFMKVRKKWWLTPIILFALLLSALIISAQGSAVAPFIYTLF